MFLDVVEKINTAQRLAQVQGELDKTMVLVRSIVSGELPLKCVGLTAEGGWSISEPVPEPVAEVFPDA